MVDTQGVNVREEILKKQDLLTPTHFFIVRENWLNKKKMHINLVGVLIMILCTVHGIPNEGEFPESVADILLEKDAENQYIKYRKYVSYSGCLPKLLKRIP